MVSTGGASTDVACASNEAGSFERAAISVGIDIGTQACKAALLQDGDVIDVTLQEHEHQADALLLPSYVSITAKGFEVGSEARKRALAGDPNTVFDFVRLVGRKPRDFCPSDIDNWPFKVVTDDSDAAVVEVNTQEPSAAEVSEASAVVRTYRPEELVAVLVRWIKERVEAQAHASADHAVVLVGGATAVAISFVYEAAVLTSYTNEGSGSNNGGAASTAAQLVLAVDIGANATDIALVSTLGRKCDVKVVDFAPNLGGDAFTDRIAAHCERKKPPEAEKRAADRSWHQARRGRGGYSRSRGQIRRACELAKKLLSASESAVVGIDCPDPDAFGCYTVTRPGFEALCRDLWQQLLQRVRDTVQESNTSLHEIDAVVLVGGSVHIPRLQALVHESFPQQRVVPRDLARVSPARGAAALRRSGQRSIALSEVTPLALGIQGVGGTRILMIPRNTKIPVRDSFVYYASCQSAVTVRVVEGRSISNAKDGSIHHLGSIGVDDSRTMGQSVLKLDVAFEVSTLAEVLVSATDLSTGRNVTKTLTADDTSLSVGAAARARARLYNRIGDSIELVYAPQNSVLQIPRLTSESLLPTEHPMQFLRAYVQALETAIASSEAVVRTISDQEKATVRAINELLVLDTSLALQSSVAPEDESSDRESHVVVMEHLGDALVSD
ncbi:hypothetical protein PybrP1_002375 [[Pythium] brassicae (nom. inval.)]|nr:hypothetical protein PybrP1_002375 [[Pythium] brassicae (nom. inval.)]